MIIGEGNFRYEWIEAWTRVPAANADNGRTHGVAVARDGRVLVFNQGNPAVLVCDAEGTIVESWGDYHGAHGLTLVEEDGREVLWLTDEKASVVRKHDLAGKMLAELPAPPAEQIDGGSDPARKKYIPTWAAVAPDGDIWVADGYGSHLIFRFAADGTFKGRLDGTEGAGRFNEPHAIAFSPDGELFITDRSNLRVCVYDADGRHLRHSDTACHSPADFAFHGGNIYVAEIAGGVKILDRQLNVLASLGDNPRITPQSSPGTWMPKQRPDQWPDLPADEQRPGFFNTPHGISVSGKGDIYVVEWVVGGRVVKLAKR